MCVRPGDIRKFLRVGDRLLIDSQEAAGVLKIKVCLGNLHHRVIVRGMHPGPARIHDALGGQRHVDCVREAEHMLEPFNGI